MRDRTLRPFLTLCLSTLLLLVQQASAQVFQPDDPLWEDPDRLDIDAPAERERSDAYDFLFNTFGDPSDYEGPALNVNTLGDVPNSSWYANRHYWDRMSLDELERGPNTVSGPSPDEPWQVVETKNEGKSIGFQIIDARGDRYLFKFDPPEYPELSTGAEVVATKLFHALGYHVPENFVVQFHPDQLVPGEDSEITEAEIRTILDKAYAYPDGTYRVMASKFLHGEPLGPFLYHGTRPDDPNDIFPHESRRELRGLRLFSAWLNHIDARSVNSLDMLVEEDGQQYVRHHLIDFGSTFGGGPLGPHRRWTSYEYAVDFWPMFWRVVSLGFAESEWLEVDYPDHPAIGHFEAEHFDPEEWVPQYPNPAFRRMDAQDAFWAAKQIMNFTDEEIRAVVSTGDYSDARVEAYLAETLIKRRDKIGEEYLDLGGGLDRFEVQNGRLVFEDLPARYGLQGNRVRSITWRPFDNSTGTLGEPLEHMESAEEALTIPESRHPYLAADVLTPESGLTRVYLRLNGGGYEVVGLERCGTSEACSVLEERQAFRQRVLALE